MDTKFFLIGAITIFIVITTMTIISGTLQATLPTIPTVATSTMLSNSNSSLLAGVTNSNITAAILSTWVDKHITFLVRGIVNPPECSTRMYARIILSDGKSNLAVTPWNDSKLFYGGTLTLTGTYPPQSYIVLQISTSSTGSGTDRYLSTTSLIGGGFQLPGDNICQQIN